MSKGVMIVGGGLAGIQASLDLAEAQVQVYLVERSPFLGGRVSQYDKIVPTDESSICLLTPKLLAAAKHHHIQVLTNSEVVSVEGQRGDFRVKLLRHPRYVEEEKCSGCGRCEHQCPVKMPRELNTGGGRAGKTIYTPFPNAVPFTYTIEKRGVAPCRDACPAGVNVQGYVALISSGKFREALSLIKEAIPFPGVCGRICSHPCEEACNRREFDEAIAIRNLKRFAADQGMRLQATAPVSPPPPATRALGGKAKVAVVGAGPAGLTAARDLALTGYRVTVMEANPLPGGMLALGIPEFRLPKAVLWQEIEAIKALGVEIRLSTRLGAGFTLRDVKRLGYEALFLAIGAHAPRRLDIPGEELRGVTDCVSLLRDFNLGRPTRIGRRVVVVGGGNAAVDVARTIIRLHSEKVDVLYRRGREEMPADERDVTEAELEGVTFHYLVSPLRIVGQAGRVVGVEGQRMRLGAPGTDGRRSFEPIPGSEFLLDADTVVVAVGQTADVAAIAETSGLALSPRGGIAVDELTLATNLPGVFAGGDAVTGPQTVIEAIASGQRAAVSVDRYLRGISLTVGREAPNREPVRLDPALEVVKLQREAAPSLPLRQRFTSFEEVEASYGEEIAVREAERCLNCGICSECLQCEQACELDAISHDRQAETLDLAVGAIVLATGFDRRKATVAGAGQVVRHENVIGELEFEMVADAPDSQIAGLLRPSDRRRVQALAFVVVEDAEHAGSDVYVAQAIRNALVARGLDPSLAAITVVTPHHPVHGQDTQRRMKRAQRHHQIRVLSGEVVGMREAPDKRVLLSVRHEGEQVEQIPVDLVVLSSAMQPWEGALALGKTIGLTLSEDGAFLEGDRALETTVPGVYLASSPRAPRDLTDTMIEASGAAARALSEMTHFHLPSPLRTEELGPVRGPVRVGVFLCRCGGNISSAVNFVQVRDRLRQLGDVAAVQEVSYACSDLGSELILERVRNLGLNRVVLGSCTCCGYDQLCPSCSHSRMRVKSKLLEAGVLNRRLFQLVNIREQCAWVHGADPEGATAKAADLLAAAVQRATFSLPAATRSVRLERAALVVGGGIAGLQCALDLSAACERVFLVEREKYWGGRVHRFPADHPGHMLVGHLVAELRARKVPLLAETEVWAVGGSAGRYEIGLRRRDRERTIRVGAVVLATGGVLHDPDGDFAHGRYANVLTTAEWDARFRRHGAHVAGRPVRHAAFLQCVGSRRGVVGCARFCCDVTLRQAISLARDGVAVTVYERGLNLELSETRQRYAEALDLGVRFVDYDPERPPVVAGAGRVETIGLPDGPREACDLVVLAVGMTPPADPSGGLFSVLQFSGLQQTYGETSGALEPGETSSPTLFVCGTAEAACGLRDAQVHGSAVAAKVAGLLAKGEIALAPNVAKVDVALCRACGTCARICRFGAVHVTVAPDRKTAAQIDELLCRGCGTCAAHCPTGAISAGNFAASELDDLLRSLLVEV